MSAPLSQRFRVIAADVYRRKMQAQEEQLFIVMGEAEGPCSVVTDRHWDGRPHIVRNITPGLLAWWQGRVEA